MEKKVYAIVMKVGSKYSYVFTPSDIENDGYTDLEPDWCYEYRDEAEQQLETLKGYCEAHDYVNVELSIETITINNPKTKTAMTLNTNDTAFYTQDSETGAIIDKFGTFEEALEAIKEYNETDKEEGTYTPDFYEIKHGTMLYDERGNAKKAHEITDQMFTKGSYGTGDHLSYFADGIECEVQGEFFIKDDGTPQHTHIFPDGQELEVYPQ